LPSAVADPEIAARKLVEIASTIEPVPRPAYRLGLAAAA